MTAGRVSRYAVSCDARECEAEFLSESVSALAARGDAAKAGWTTHLDSIDGLPWDYCPEHKVVAS